jgi:hypothetical protein
MQNQIEVDLKMFNSGLKTFKIGMPRKNSKPKTDVSAVISFSGGFLSIECDDKVSVMRAEGTWNGKARFSPTIIRALTLVPPSESPVVIKYENSKLSIGSTKIPCEWTLASQGMLDKVTNPTLIDIFAMWRSQPVEMLLGRGIKQENQSARSKLLKVTAKLALKLVEFEVTQEDLIAIVEAKIQKRILEYSDQEK